MGFYDDEVTAEQYVEMAEGFDGRALIDVLQNHLAQNSTLLEIGMGPGTDLSMLAAHFRATGSDSSIYFLDRYRRLRPDADLLQLDAITLETDRTFDCVYSNKVLHHLTEDELLQSFRRQKAILTSSGLIMHSFWRGTGTEEHEGLRFVNQTESSLRALVSQTFKIVDVVTYEEMAENDSLYVLATV